MQKRKLKYIIESIQTTMEIKSQFLDGTLDVSISPDKTIKENEFQYEVFLGSTVAYMSRDEWHKIKDFIDSAMDFIDENY